MLLNTLVILPVKAAYGLVYILKNLAWLEWQVGKIKTTCICTSFIKIIYFKHYKTIIISQFYINTYWRMVIEKHKSLINHSWSSFTMKFIY